MIEFYGVLSDECKLERARELARVNGRIFLIATIVLSVPLLFFGIKNGVWYLAVGLSFLLAVMTIVAYRPEKRLLNLKIPSKVLIENGTIFVSSVGGKGRMRARPLKKVKTVIDRGSYYMIVFKFGDITNSCLCQKDLMKQGTIEEFEKLFPGKIVRNLKNQ